MTTKPAATVAQTLPKFDFEAVIALQKANLETMVTAQKILFDLAQTVAKRQGEMLKETFSKGENLFQGFDAKKQPAEYMDEARAVMEKAMVDVKETIDLSMKAQNEVVDLLVKRATKNLEDVKTLAA
ncbi:MAG: phasin family protein [Geminicoccaceae bacterium]|nr:phasin family protein [Geminicoccaceae bacterium]MCB9943975.1 phasin family protein [Geminicoccaceae bacterium]